MTGTAAADGSGDLWFERQAGFFSLPSALGTLPSEARGKRVAVGPQSGTASCIAVDRIRSRSPRPEATSTFLPRSSESSRWKAARVRSEVAGPRVTSRSRSLSGRRHTSATSPACPTP